MDFENEKNITIFTHPLIQHKISILRDKKTGTNEFRKLVEEIAMLEGFEALSDLYQFDNGDYLVSRIGRIDEPLSAVLICDSKGNNKKELLQRDTRYAIDNSDSWELEIFDNTINFISPILNNTIYNYNKGELNQTLSFNILPFPTKEFYTRNPEVLGLGPHYLRTIYKESRKWIYLAFSSNSKGLKILLYNKLTGEYQIGQDTENDIDNKVFIAQTSASANNTFTYCIQGENDNNPIIQTLHLK